jgi:F-box-like
VEQSPANLTNINRLPDEVLLEIFDLYRQSIINQYDYQWRKKYGWFNLAHVCRRWHAAMFASTSRLDLNIVVGPEKPSHIKTILSGHLPILIDYSDPYGIITASALWRMRAALRHRNRVREISFGGYGVTFKKFIKATNYHFPALESLVLSFPRFPRDHGEPDIPATFLRGPDRSDLPLRRLSLYDASLASVSGLLLSATALTDLTLSVNAANLGPSEASLILTCLQGAQCLRSLDLSAPYGFPDCRSQDSIATPKDIVPLSKLTRFQYYGPTTFLNDLMSGLSAPSLQDVCFVLCKKSPLLYLSRVIDSVGEEFRSVSVTFDKKDFHLLSSTHSGEIDHFKPSSGFRFNVNHSPYSINSINSTSSMKFAMAEELTLNFSGWEMTYWPEHVFSMREFLRQFRSVRVLRVNPFAWHVGLHLKHDQDDGEAILPVLEQVELTISRSITSPDMYQRRAAEALAAFEPCERAGRPVKVYICDQMQMQCG